MIDIEDRLQAAAEEVRSAAQFAVPRPMTAASPGTRRFPVLAVAGAVVVAGLLIGVAVLLRLTVTEEEVTTPTDDQTTETTAPAPEAQNGLIAFRFGNGGLFVMASDGSAARRLSDESAGDSSWSPDGRRIAFVADTGLMVMDSDGTGETQVLEGSGIHHVAWSPDGRRIAFTQSGAGQSHVFVVDVDGTDLRQLTTGRESAWGVAWSPDADQIAFARDAVLWYQASDTAARLRGDTTQLGGVMSIIVMDADGANQRTLIELPAIVNDPAWSPDGSTIVFSYRELPASGLPSSYDPPWDIWIVGADGSGPRLLTEGEPSELDPAWSPDGTQIVFTRVAVEHGIYVMNADGGDVRRLRGNPTPMGWPSWAVAVPAASAP